MLDKILRKIKIGYYVIKGEGVLNFSIRSLQYIQKKKSQIPGEHPSQKQKIHTSAIYDEIIRFDPNKPANSSWDGLSKNKKLVINWLMPPPGKGSGGHMTLFRFIRYLEQSGHVCRIYFHKPGEFSTVESVRAIMGDQFAKVNADMAWLQQGSEMQAADAIFATSWETAYTVYCSKVKAKKFYFVQDFEPYFYPTGSLSILAENTYRMGLRGITAGGWLKKRLNEGYGMTTDSFWFGSDSSIYTYENGEKRTEVVFYARPYTDRRAFEIGILTLDIFHKMHPDYIINFIGWDVSSYDIPFPYNNLGVLDPNELNQVYNRCAISLVMSLTNMSLLPLELISSGCIPVVNDGDNNRLVSDNQHIAYSQNDPVSLASKMSEIINMKNLPRYSKKASLGVSDLSWDASGEHFVRIFEESIKKPLDG